MAGRWRDPTAFRADPAATPASRPSRRQSTALIVVLLLVAGAVAVASFVVRPDRARSFDLFHGSMFLANLPDPIAVDLATGKPTVRLSGAAAQVGATNAVDLAVVPLDGESLLLNKQTGEFNLVDTTGFVVKRTGGVPLPPRAGSASVGIASGNLAYIEQTGPSGTSVYRVDKATVQSAVSTKNVKPRASRTMLQPARTDPGAAAADSNGDLWLLMGTGQQRTIRRLSVPANSNPGATLTTSDRGTVTGAAAIESASTASGSPAIGVASADRIQLFGIARRTIRFGAQPGVDTVLPTSNADGRLSFLLHGTAGWSTVSVNADGSALRGPKPLSTVTPSAQLAPPAQSRGSLYTLDGVSGQLLRIDDVGRAHAIKGAPVYPRTVVGGRIIEPGGFADAYAVADGARVIYNSPSHLEALALFTDGSHHPLTIQKGDAVAVSASGGAEALTKNPAGALGTSKGTPPKNGGTTPKPAPGQPINNQIECKNTTQKPHIPKISQATPGSRSVLLGWTYPIVGQQDCQPQTYQVKVKLLSNGAPNPPGTVTVGNQQSVNLTGLFPSSQYEITVFAYIGGQGTPSQPIRVTTGPEGPAAPTNLAVSAGSSGNWTVNWASCGTASQGCIPATSWKVIPRFCDGRGLGNPPDPISVDADPTARAQPPAALDGGDALLGRGLSFQVEGIGVQGTVGTPSKTSACVQSWAPPNRGALTLSASKPADVALGSTSSTNVTLNLGSDPTKDVGGIGAAVTFTLTGPSGSTTKTVTFTAAATTLSANFGGVRAGANYSATAVVRPPGHAGSAVTVGPQPVSTRASWPTGLALSATCPSDGGLGLTCTLAVHITGISSAAANGELFDFNGNLTCGGSTGAPVAKTGYDPSQTDIVVTGISQLNGLFGTCRVAGALTESGGSSSPQVFGGTTSPTIVDDSVNLGAPAASGVGAGDFTVAWNGNSVIVHYTGSANLNSLTENWSEKINPPGTGSCDFTDPQTTPDPDAVIQIRQTCINDNGATSAPWVVAISYDDKTDGTSHSFTETLAGPPPGFQLACNPSGDFTASWGATIKDGVSVKFGGTQADIAGCSNFSYTLNAPAQACGTASGNNNASPATIAIAASCGPPDGTWRVTVTYDSQRVGPNQSLPPITPDGTPPTS